MKSIFYSRENGWASYFRYTGGECRHWQRSSFRKCRLSLTINDIVGKKQTRVSDTLGTTVKPIVHKFYKMTDYRKKFYATDECTGCGLCANNCPCQAIVMENNKPLCLYCFVPLCDAFFNIFLDLLLAWDYKRYP